MLSRASGLAWICLVRSLYSRYHPSVLLTNLTGLQIGSIPRCEGDVVKHCEMNMQEIEELQD